jgi:hypothetical protein
MIVYRITDYLGTEKCFAREHAALLAALANSKTRAMEFDREITTYVYRLKVDLTKQSVLNLLNGDGGYVISEECVGEMKGTYETAD